MEIRPAKAELFIADGQTDTTKLNNRFPYFANAPKIDYRNPCEERFHIPHDLQ